MEDLRDKERVMPRPGEDNPEKAWSTAIADELREVERQADRLSQLTHYEAEQAHRQWVKHQHDRPEEPRGFGAMFGGQGKYEAELSTWEHRQAELMARYVCTQDRADRVEQYRNDADEPSGAAHQLAEERAKKHHPELAEAAQIARAEREQVEAQQARDEAARIVEQALTQQQEQEPEKPDPLHGVDPRHGIRDMAGAEMEMDFA